MKIYFAGSIRGGRDDQAVYFSIIEELSKYGTVLTEHIGSKTLVQKGENLPMSKIYECDLNWIKECDVIVAEVTQPSLGVGYEIGRAEAFGKKVLCLFREDSDKLLSGMMEGNPNVKIIKYKTIDDLKMLLTGIKLSE